MWRSRKACVACERLVRRSSAINEDEHLERLRLKLDPWQELCGKDVENRLQVVGDHAGDPRFVGVGSHDESRRRGLALLLRVEMLESAASFGLEQPTPHGHRQGENRRPALLEVGAGHRCCHLGDTRHGRLDGEPHPPVEGARHGVAIRRRRREGPVGKRRAHRVAEIGVVVARRSDRPDLHGRDPTALVDRKPYRHLGRKPAPRRLVRHHQLRRPDGERTVGRSGHTPCGDQQERGPRTSAQKAQVPILALLPR